VSTALNNVETADAWTAAATLLCPDTVMFDLFVANAAVRYQVARGNPPAWDEPEADLPPVAASLDVLADAIRFRSATAGEPARVSVKAYASAEVPGG
jgi:hypothetical protein